MSIELRIELFCSGCGEVMRYSPEPHINFMGDYSARIRVDPCKCQHTSKEASDGTEKDQRR